MDEQTCRERAKEDFDVKPRKTAKQILAFLMDALENLEQPKARIDPDACMTYLETMDFDAASLRNILSHFGKVYPTKDRADKNKLMGWISTCIPWQEIETAMEVQNPNSLEFG